MNRLHRSQKSALSVLLALAMIASASPLSAGTRADVARYLEQSQKHLLAAQRLIAERGQDDCRAVQLAIEQIDLSMARLSDAQAAYPIDDRVPYEQRRAERASMQDIRKQLAQRRSELVKQSWRAC